MSNKKDTGVTPAALLAALMGDLGNAAVAMRPGGIEAQEAQGQKDFVASETLPRLCPRAELEHLGFVFGQDADETFVYVTFPEGWKKVPTDHSMWSDLLDDKDRKRAAIFFKAAFYDYHAEMDLTPRFSYSRVYDNHDEYIKGQIQWYVADGNDIIFRTDPLKFEKEYDEEWFKLGGNASKLARSWLDKNYPEWENPMAYWED